MKLILVEGAKNVGKTTNFATTKLNKNELIEYKTSKNRNTIYVDRMFIKQYIYGRMGLNDAFFCANIFDEIIIILPSDLDQYINTITKRMSEDKEYNQKMNKTHQLFNKYVKECDFEKFLILQIRRYFRVMQKLVDSEIYTLKEIKKGKTNININIFMFKKKHPRMLSK